MDMNKGYSDNEINISPQKLHGDHLADKQDEMPMSEFKKLYDTVFPILYRVSLRVTRSSEAAEDLCQDSFFQLYKKKMVFATPDEAKYWLIRVVKNASINYSKRKDKERHVYLKAFREQTKVQDGGEEALLKKESIEVMQDALNKLPKALRDVLIYKEYAGMNYKEIGKALGISEGNVKVRVFRARERLSALLCENSISKKSMPNYSESEDNLYKHSKGKNNE
ncbi:MAG: hypothetical protein Ta2B_01270 [Termitinemataceae bacterium]|nr:MAG: hypothetical protein Ta2B_01270 [Termitinemataceae bacterium]